MKTPGFGLLELLIAIAISSFIALILFQAFNQSTRTLNITDGISTTYINIISCYHRLENDISGAFVPPMGDPVRAVLKEQKQEIQTPTKKQPEQQKSEKEKSDTSVKNVFVYEQDGNHLKLLTFVTRNRLLSATSTNPCILRVIYTLKPDPEKNTEFMLMRAESSQLSFDSVRELDQGKTRFYPLLRHIKRCTCELKALDVKKVKEEQARKKQTEQSGKKEPETPFNMPPTVTYKQWPPEKSAIKKDETEPGVFPLFIKIIITYHDVYRDLDVNVTFVSAPQGKQSTSTHPPKVPLITFTTTQEKSSQNTPAQTSTQESTDRKQTVSA